jgi:hypothetical protein
MVGRERTRRIGDPGIPGHVKGLTAASPKIYGAAVTSAAGVGEPTLSAEQIKAGGVMPNLGEVVLLDVFKMQSR